MQIIHREAEPNLKIMEAKIQRKADINTGEATEKTRRIRTENKEAGGRHKGRKNLG